MLSTLFIFKSLIAIHIVGGSIGLLSFWVPVAGQKGGATHRRFGKVFINTMLITGTTAVAIAITTLWDPEGTHPHLAQHAVFSNPLLIEGIFGWMMLYLATLTLNLAWHGRLCMVNRNNHTANRAWHNLLSQVLLTATAANCFYRGWELGQPMMLGISMVGFATVGTNLWFLYVLTPSRTERIREHIKSLVGAGISVYTAFFAFGAVRIMPELALTPALWSVPLIVGLTLIIYHRRAVALQSIARGLTQ